MSFESFAKTAIETIKEANNKVDQFASNFDLRKPIEQTAYDTNKHKDNNLKEQVDIDKRIPESGMFGKKDTKDINGYTYTLDRSGRTISARGDLRLDPAAKDLNAQKRAGGADRLKTDDGGHIFSSRFGGTGEVNLIAQDARLNRGDYKKLENSWVKALNEGKSVYVKVDLNYRGDSLRPDKIKL